MNYIQEEMLGLQSTPFKSVINTTFDATSKLNLRIVGVQSKKALGDAEVYLTMSPLLWL